MSDVPTDPLAPPHDQGPASQDTARPERVIFRSPWGNTAPAAPAVSAEQLAQAIPAERQAMAPQPVTPPPPIATTPATTPAAVQHPGAPLVNDLQFLERPIAVPAPIPAAEPGPEVMPAPPESAVPEPETALYNPPAPPLTPAQGGWAALILLLMQNLLGGLAEYWHLSLGWPLLVAFALTILGFFALLSYPMRLLRQDSRWQTRPRIGLTLGAFLLGFTASRGILLFGVSLWPAALSAVPQFLGKGSDLFPLFLAAGLCIPVAEEIAFRGLLLRGLERARGPLFSALLTSGLFAMAHGSPLQVVAIFPLAWVMARAVQYSGSLWTSVGMHMLNNSLAVLLGALLGGKLSGSPLGGMELATSQRVPLSMGLAGLLLGLGALAIATLWLKPRYASPQVDKPPRVWTVSTIFLLAFVVFAVGLLTWRILSFNVQNVNF